MQSKVKLFAIVSSIFVIACSSFLAGSLFFPRKDMVTIAAAQPMVDLLATPEATSDDAAIKDLSGNDDTPHLFIAPEKDQDSVYKIAIETEDHKNTAATDSSKTPSPVEGKKVATPKKVTPEKVAPKKEFVTQNAYWVQLASFSSEIKAKEERDFFRAQGYPALIETVAIDNKTNYRLRLGAWSSKEEANKFKIKIGNEYENYKDALIMQTQMLKEI